MDIKSFWPELGPSLEEASVYLNKYKNKKIVLKYGGQVMSDQSLSKAFAQDAAILRKLDIDVTVIHGGGPQIKTKLDAQNLESKFISGLRVTDKNVIKVVEDVLLNEINPDLRDAINHYGGKAESVTVRKNNIIHIDKAIDEQLGFVGEPKKINIETMKKTILFVLLFFVIVFTIFLFEFKSAIPLRLVSQIFTQIAARIKIKVVASSIEFESFDI